MRDYPYKIEANSEARHGVDGNFVRVASSSGPLRIVAADKDGKELANVILSSGYFKVPPGKMFSKVSVRNENPSQATATLTIGYGEVDAMELSGEVSLEKSTIIDSAADVSVNATASKQVVAANAIRREVLVSNLSSNAAAFRIGDSGVGAANGVELLPGSTITLETAGAVYAYNTGAGAQSLGVLEVTD